jgi:Tol biopolymer transport system component
MNTLPHCSGSAGKKETSMATDITYPQPLPDSTALTFLPNLVSKDSFDFNAAFSPDGRSYYFTRNINHKTIIHVSHYNDTNWTEPMPIDFGANGHSDADPAFAPDGKLYFISDRPKNASDTLPDFDIWVTSPLANNSWSAPQRLESINTDSNEFYISFGANGNLYFASSRPGGYGEEDIYVSRLVNAQYTTPTNLGPAINTARAEFDPFITAREDLLVFASSNRADGFGGADLYYAQSANNQTWQPAIHFDNRINTNTRDFCPYFSPDLKYFFFSSERNVKWINAAYLRKIMGL